MAKLNTDLNTGTLDELLELELTKGRGLARSPVELEADKLAKAILEGGSTGDRFLDLAIADHGAFRGHNSPGSYNDIASIAWKLNDYLKAHPGELVLLQEVWRKGGMILRGNGGYNGRKETTLVGKLTEEGLFVAEHPYLHQKSMELKGRRNHYSPSIEDHRIAHHNGHVNQAMEQPLQLVIGTEQPLIVINKRVYFLGDFKQDVSSDQEKRPYLNTLAVPHLKLDHGGYVAYLMMDRIFSGLKIHPIHPPIAFYGVRRVHPDALKSVRVIAGDRMVLRFLREYSGVKGIDATRLNALYQQLSRNLPKESPKAERTSS